MPNPFSDLLSEEEVNEFNTDSFLGGYAQPVIDNWRARRAGKRKDPDMQRYLEAVALLPLERPQESPVAFMPTPTPEPPVALKYPDELFARGTRGMLPPRIQGIMGGVADLL